MPRGRAHIQATFNNTHGHHLPIPMATSLSWGSAGASNFKGSRKSTPYAAQVTAEGAARKARIMAYARSTSTCGARAPAARPPFARCRRRVAGRPRSPTSRPSRTTAAVHRSAVASSRGGTSVPADGGRAQECGRAVALRSLSAGACVSDRAGPADGVAAMHCRGTGSRSRAMRQPVRRKHTNIRR